MYHWKGSPRKPKSPEKKGASIILWYTDKDKDRRMILTGRESRYLFERKKLFPNPNVIKIHEIIPFTTYESARSIFKNKAIELEYLHLQELKNHYFEDTNHEVRFDTPIVKDKKIKVNFRFSNNDCSFGIIKGNREIEDTDTKQTIVRETKEELGFLLDESKIQNLVSLYCSDYDSFHYEVSEKEKIEILKCIQSQKEEKSGELFELSFQELDEKFKKHLIKPFWNQKSICAINNFLQKDKKSVEGEKYKRREKSKGLEKYKKSHLNFTQKLNRLRH